MSENNGRDQMTGRFVKGWKGGPGNGLSRREHEIRTWFSDQATEEELATSRARLVSDVQDGQPAATKIYWEYMMGKAMGLLAVDVSSADGASVTLPAIVNVLNVVLADYPDVKIKVAAALSKLGSDIESRVESECLE
jgi:hypothetical protein